MEWQEKYGRETNQKAGGRIAPFEKEQWLRREVSKFGRDRSTAEEDWARHEGSHCKRDRQGHRGALRLWLPKNEYNDHESNTLIRGEAVEGSDRRRKPTASDIDAYRRHAWDASVGRGFGNEFFSGTSTQASRSVADAAEDDGKDDGITLDGASAQAPQAPGAPAVPATTQTFGKDSLEPKPSPKMPPAQKRYSLSDDSEQDDKEKKDKARRGSVFTARTSLYTRASRELVPVGSDCPKVFQLTQFMKVVSCGGVLAFRF